MSILSSPHFHITKPRYPHHHGTPNQIPTHVPTRLLILRRSSTVLCKSSSSSTEPSGSDDFVTRVLKENPRQVQPKYLIGDKFYTLKEKENLGKKSNAGIFDVLRRLNQTKPQSKNENESESEVSGERDSVYLKDLLKEYRGKLYVPEHIFGTQLSEEEEFDRNVNELPRMSIEEFRKAMSKDKVKLITSKEGGGVFRDFVVELKEIPGDKSLHTTKWVLRLSNGEAQSILADYTGPRYEIERRHTMVDNLYLFHGRTVLIIFGSASSKRGNSISFAYFAFRFLFS